MRHIRQYSLFTFIILLLLTALACQAATTVSSTTTEEVSRDAVVRDAVATVEAELPRETTTGADDPPTVNTQLAQVDLDLQSALIEIYQRVNPAVVHIFALNQLEDADTAVPFGTGSGFVYDREGHIVTNNHVVTDLDEFEVAFADGSRQSATVVGTDIDSDLAVIKVDSLPAGVEPVPVGDSTNLQVGQLVVAIGNPFRETGSMTLGIVSGLGRTLESQRITEGGGRYSLPEVIQTDAAINPGNSGGPLLNLQGEVVGVNSAILSRTGTNSGVGFSIPSAAVKQVIPSLIERGEYTYPFIGISMANEDLFALQHEDLGLPLHGVYVVSVVSDSPADEAGLIGSGDPRPPYSPGGDFITAIDGQAIQDSTDLISYLVFQTEVGQTVDLTIIRDGEETVVPLTLQERP